MPQNFPEAWLDRVEQNLVNQDEAPWLAGIPEIANEVTEINGGSESEANQVHIPTTDFEVDILINNNTYPIPVQQYADGTVTIQLDKYQTKQVPLSDDQVIGASYAIIDTVTNIMTINIVENKYAKAIHSLAPAGNTTDTPVLQSTGKTGEKNADGTDQVLMDGQRKRLTYLDLVTFKNAVDKSPKKWPKKGRRLVLCIDHWNDLLLDRKNFGDQLVNYTTGDVAPVILGFEIYQHLSMPSFNGTTKLAYNAVPTTGQYEGSVAFHTQNVGIKTGITKQYYKPSNLDPSYQSNSVAYRHYYIVTPKRARYIAAIASAYVAP